MKKLKYVKLFENFQVNESILDKFKSAVGAELKAPKQFDTKDIDGKQLTSEQKDVKNKIIMVLNDINKNISNSYYIVELKAIKLVDKGLVFSTYSKGDQISELEEDLKAKGLKVSKTSESSSSEMDSGDYSPSVVSITNTTMTITK
jgi:hypothetical protein